MIGQSISHYRILERLGGGGMGVVYKAEDNALHRFVALKFLPDELANDPNALARFQREAHLASSLNHPHILTVFETGEFEGRRYLVTEFVDGGTLRDWANAENRSWRHVVELLIGVADGVAAAHQAGIVHRDIKLANILVAKSGYAKLADFGLAKPTEARAGDATRTVDGTTPGMIIGTVAYMSPEQALGKPVDARSDVFSFGVVLYELLSGRHPFTGASDLETLQTIIHGVPPRLSEDVPVALEAVVEKALEKDPADRYQTMRDMVVEGPGRYDSARCPCSAALAYRVEDWAGVGGSARTGRNHRFVPPTGMASKADAYADGTSATPDRSCWARRNAGHLAGWEDGGVRRGNWRPASNLGPAAFRRNTTRDH
jgi:serine/threonine protein kinase